MVASGAITKMLKNSFEAGRHGAKKGDGLAESVAKAFDSGVGARGGAMVSEMTYGAGRIFNGLERVGSAPWALLGTTGVGLAGSAAGLVVLYLAANWFGVL